MKINNYSFFYFPEKLNTLIQQRALYRLLATSFLPYTFNFVLCTLFFGLSTLNLHAQSVGITESGAPPNAKAILDLQPDVNFNKGVLFPRLTTTQRNAIAPTATENSLFIFNTTTQCYEGYNAPSSTWVAFGCIGCTAPTGVTATAAPTSICVGSTLTLTGVATNATIWQWIGPDEFTSTEQSPTVPIITTERTGVYILTASNTCAAAPPVSTVSITVTAAPTVATAGPDQNLACGLTTATLAANTPTTGTGLWSVVSGTATITSPTSPTSGVTGLAAVGTVTLRWTISNGSCTPSTDDVGITTTGACFTGCIPTANTVLVPVLNPTTTKTWMDRNLGASQVATSSTDAAAYGCLYQWGRAADGHEDRASGTTATLSSTDNPGHGLYITTPVSPNDWRSPKNDNLWQGVAGINNPCPVGYRVPSQAELDAERLSWGSNNAAGAFASPLKLSMGGDRNNSAGTLQAVGTNGNYWSSDISFTAGSSKVLFFKSNNALMSDAGRVFGYSVRCIKN